MQATAIVAEILIVGLQAAGWLFLVVLTVFGPRVIDRALPQSDVVVAAIGLGAVYVLGVLADRAADSSITALRKTAFGRWISRVFGKRRKPAEQPPSPGNVGKKRLFVMYHGGGGMGAFLEYQRSRHRIARATVFNLAFAVPAAAVFAGVREHALAHPGLWSVGIVLGVGVLLVAIFADVRIDEAFIARLNDAVEVIMEHRPDLKYPN